MMVFNGLAKSDLIVYNALLEMIRDDQPVGIREIAHKTCYHPNTVYRAIQRLAQYQVIDRVRPGRGSAYIYTIKE